MKQLKNIFACAICPESFSNVRYLVGHVQTKHSTLEPCENEEKSNETNVQFIQSTKTATKQNLSKSYFVKEPEGNLSENTDDRGSDDKIKIQHFAVLPESENNFESLNISNTEITNRIQCLAKKLF